MSVTTSRWGLAGKMARSTGECVRFDFNRTLIVKAVSASCDGGSFRKPISHCRTLKEERTQGHRSAYRSAIVTGADQDSLRLT